MRWSSPTLLPFWVASLDLFWIRSIIESLLLITKKPAITASIIIDPLSTAYLSQVLIGPHTITWDNLQWISFFLSAAYISPNFRDKDAKILALFIFSECNFLEVPTAAEIVGWRLTLKIPNAAIGRKICYKISNLFIKQMILHLFSELEYTNLSEKQKEETVPVRLIVALILLIVETHNGQNS